MKLLILSVTQQKQHESNWSCHYLSVKKTKKTQLYDVVVWKW